MGKVKHSVIASNPKLALDWLIMQGYTRRVAHRMIQQRETPTMLQR
jgi:hypothetical protein